MSSKIKILHLAKWYPNENDPQNGVFVEALIRGNSSFSDQAVIYWGPGQSTHSEFKIEEAIPVYRHYFQSGKRIQNANRKWASIRKAIDDTWNGQLPDIIHLHVADVDQLLIVEYAKKKNIPVILSEHWSGYVDGRFDSKNTIAQSLFKHLIKKVDYCTAVSEYLAQGIRKSSGREAIDIIPNAVNVESRDKAKQDASIRHFAMLCDLDDKVKNISGAMRAFKRYHEKNPNSTLSIIGGGKDEANLIRLSQKMELTQEIAFRGRHPHSESLDILNEANTVIINSPRETFSIVSLEAIALGKKLICTRSGGPEGFLRDELVQWVEPNNEEDLLNALLASDHHPFPTQEQIIQQIEPFLPEVISTKWQQYYQQALK
ncbi:MAG: glycosyltransferase [Flavobacteriia bacterium]|nr:glycosyltransferase [Flavobacteriia bacterium]